MDTFTTFNLAISCTGIFAAKTLFELTNTYPDPKQMAKKCIIPVALAALAANQAIESYSQLNRRTMPTASIDPKIAGIFMGSFTFIISPLVVGGIESAFAIAGFRTPGFLVPANPAPAPANNPA